VLLSGIANRVPGSALADLDVGLRGGDQVVDRINDGSIALQIRLARQAYSTCAERAMDFLCGRVLHNADVKGTCDGMCFRVGPDAIAMMEFQPLVEAGHLQQAFELPVLLATHPKASSRKAESHIHIFLVLGLTTYKPWNRPSIHFAGGLGSIISSRRTQGVFRIGARVGGCPHQAAA